MKIIVKRCLGHTSNYHVSPFASIFLFHVFFSYLDDIGQHGESSGEYLALYKRLISMDHWKFYLSLCGVLNKIGDLINKVLL